MPDASMAPALKDLGLAGYMISVMASAILALATANVVQWKNSNKLTAKTNAERLSERDILLSALNNTGKVVEAITRTSEARNLVTEDLVEAVAAWTASMEVIKERMQNQHESNTEKLKDIKFVVGSFAESQRTLTAIVTEVRNWQIANGGRGR